MFLLEIIINILMFILGIAWILAGIAMPFTFIAFFLSAFKGEKNVKSYKHRILDGEV